MRKNGRKCHSFSFIHSFIHSFIFLSERAGAQSSYLFIYLCWHSYPVSLSILLWPLICLENNNNKSITPLTRRARLLQCGITIRRKRENGVSCSASRHRHRKQNTGTWAVRRWGANELRGNIESGAAKGKVCLVCCAHREWQWRNYGAVTRRREKVNAITLIGKWGK